jgi:hypothetical protein
MGTRWGMTCKLDQSRHPLEPEGLECSMYTSLYV